MFEPVWREVAEYEAGDYGQRVAFARRVERKGKKYEPKNAEGYLPENWVREPLGLDLRSCHRSEYCAHTPIQPEVRERDTAVAKTAEESEYCGAAGSKARSKDQSGSSSTHE